MKRKPVSIVIHIAGVIAFLSLPVLFLPDDMSFSDVFFSPPDLVDFINYGLLVIYFYINFYLLLPNLYFKKKYILFSLITLLIFLLITFVPALIILRHPPGDGSFQGEPPPPPEFILYIMLRFKFFLFLVVFFFSLMIRLTNKWKQAEKERVSAQLANLKAQINPHFLFNTLNSIYSLALEKSEYTATAVVKLSGMMRYLISEASGDFVSLDREINYISDYIELQKLRLAETIKLTYMHTGDTGGMQIAPLILIPFVENAFKHGVNPEENSEISIYIDVGGNGLMLTVNNTKVKTMQDHDVQSGLGLENTRSRLQHLYPSKHNLNIKESEKEFIVRLTLDLR
jgi:hypothetical protein